LRRLDAETEAEQGALARAVAAEEDGDAIARDGDGEAIERLDAAVPLRHFARGDRHPGSVHRFLPAPASCACASMRRASSVIEAPARSAASVARSKSSSVSSRRSRRATLGAVEVTKTPDPLRPSTAPSHSSSRHALLTVL